MKFCNLIQKWSQKSDCYCIGHIECILCLNTLFPYGLNDRLEIPIYMDAEVEFLKEACIYKFSQLKLIDPVITESLANLTIEIMLTLILMLLWTHCAICFHQVTSKVAEPLYLILLLKILFCWVSMLLLRKVTLMVWIAFVC